MKKLSYGIPITTRNAICDFCGENKECFSGKSYNVKTSYLVPTTEYKGGIFSTGHEEVTGRKWEKDIRKIEIDICKDCVKQLNNFCNEESHE